MTIAPLTSPVVDDLAALFAEQAPQHAERWQVWRALLAVALSVVGGDEDTAERLVKRGLCRFLEQQPRRAVRGQCPARVAGFLLAMKTGRHPGTVGESAVAQFGRMRDTLAEDLAELRQLHARGRLLGWRKRDLESLAERLEWAEGQLREALEDTP